MGTTTIYTRFNDLGARFENLSKADLKELGKLSPYSKDAETYRGWKAAYELHNGNVYALVFWKGKLMKLEEAPKILTRKYWDKYRGKTLNVYEWTLLKRRILNQIEYLDKGFRKGLRGREAEE